jgi:hypothetical protein
MGARGSGAEDRHTIGSICGDAHVWRVEVGENVPGLV